MNRVAKITGKNRKKAIAASVCIILAAAALLNLEERKERRWWVRPWLNRKKGNILLPEEFILFDDEKYANYLRMDKNLFKKLLKMIENKITK